MKTTIQNILFRLTRPKLVITVGYSEGTTYTVNIGYDFTKRLITWPFKLGLKKQSAVALAIFDEAIYAAMEEAFRLSEVDKFEMRRTFSRGFKYIDHMEKYEGEHEIVGEVVRYGENEPFVAVRLGHDGVVFKTDREALKSIESNALYRMSKIHIRDGFVTSIQPCMERGQA